ncbi:MAG: ABC transporter transmembrane domain-containing protein, partial [Halalkalicoccus sp.]
MSTDSEGRTLEDRREGVRWPMVRLLREYGRPEGHWFALGIVGTILATAAGLVPPLVLGIAIDAVFVETGAFSLPIVPDAWLPTTQDGQFWLSAALIGVAFLGTAFFDWVRGASLNLFSHFIQHAIRTATYRKMQSLDMTFFDEKQTGEVMSVLNNDVGNLEIFLDNGMHSALRLVVMVIGVTGILFRSCEVHCWGAL